MSDANPNDPAIEIVRKRICQLDTEIALHKHRAETASQVRDELAELATSLGKMGRPRKPRVVADAPTETAPDAPRPTVFAIPANDVRDAEAAA